MNIVVCIKQVPDTTEVKINPVTGTLIREGVPSIMNPDDKGGLEYALQLKDKYGAHVTVITMGLPQAEAILREALAMGVDRAILLTDRKLGGADTLATSSALAGALRTMDVDLIITGRQAIDGDTAQVGPQIAEHLDLPQVSYMEDLQYDEATKTFTIKKQLEDGYQILEMQAPCVVTALASSVQPRYMTVNGIVTAFDKEIEVWGADRINVPEDHIGKAGSPTSVFKSFPKQLKPAGQTFEVSPEEAVELIVNKLKEEIERGFTGAPKGCYIQLEKKATRAVLENISRSFRDHGELVSRIRSFAEDSGEELTFARFLGVPEGSVYGYEARDWDGMMARMQMIGDDYPIKGLRPIGAAGPRSDGYSATIICGQLIAASALKDLKTWSEGGNK